MSRGMETQAIQNLVEQRDMVEEQTHLESVQDAEMLGEYCCNIAVLLLDMHARMNLE